MKKLDLTKKQKRKLMRIILSLSLFIIIFILDKTIVLSSVFGEHFGWLFPFVLYLMVFLIIGYDVLIKSAKGIIHGQVFDENFLMSVATLGAFALAIYRGIAGLEIEGFDEACAVLIFYQVGEFFQNYAVGKSRKSISKLMDIRPDIANVIRDDETQEVDPSEVLVGEIILVNPGEKVPLDGIIVKGSSTIDTKALTGESLPRDVSEGSDIMSGCVNLSSSLEIKVTKAFYDSTVSKILDLVENASSKKSKAENFITKFSRVYTPAVCAIALILAVVPSLVFGEWGKWIYRALSFLVVSCPCALVISIPLSFFAGIGAGSKYGILIKGSNYLEKFNNSNIFVFDKTGTLTKGNFNISEISPAENADEILHLAAIAEQNSNHPIAKSITSKFGKEIETGFVITNISGKGIVAIKETQEILCGNEKLMEEYGVDFKKQTGIGTVVYVAKDKKFIGSILISDEIKDESRQVISELNLLGCRTMMLTGDNEEIAQSVATQIGLTDYKSSLLPQNKVEEVSKLLASKKEKDVLCFVGDGINDAPVLMQADIGISMGGVGSDAAIEASDIVLMKDDLKGISLAKRIAKKTMNIVFQNIFFSIFVKVAILILTAFGFANMWLAVFGDVGVAVIAILNAMRVNSDYDKNRNLKLDNNKN